MISAKDTYQYDSVESLFKTCLPDIKIDKSFMKKVEYYKIKWMNKNQDHVEFLGGNLLGVNPIRFSAIDEEIFFDDIVQHSPDCITKGLKSTKGINPAWKVSSNTFYQTLIYLMHLTYKSKLSLKDKNKLLEDLYMLFAFKAFSSMVYNGFSKYNLSKDVAVVVYERLSMKFLLKQLGSWYEVFKYRSNDIKIPDGVRYPNILRYTTEDTIITANDLQGRLKDIFSYIYNVITKVIEEGDRINTTSLINTINDEDGLTAVLNRPDMYVKYLISVLPKENDFIKEELVNIIVDIVKNIDRDSLITVLKALSENSLKDKKTENFIEKTFTLCVAYLIRKRQTEDLVSTDLGESLLLLKGYWNASKVKDKDVRKIKETLFKFSKKHLNRSTKWYLTAVSNGVILYIYLRALAKNN